VGMGLARGHEIWAALNAIHVERAIWMFFFPIFS
jgi:hypothetical protein